MAFHLVQLLYWLSVSTWFGGVMFITLSAPVIFRTVGQSNPILPDVLSVNLENQHGTLLAGSIVANLLGVLARVELVCAGGTFLGLLGQWFVSDISYGNLWMTILRSAMLVAAVVLVFYNRQVVTPRLWRFRQQYIDNADTPEVANPAKDEFDRYHRESVTVLSVRLFLLLGIILFSGNIVPATRTIFFPK